MRAEEACGGVADFPGGVLVNLFGIEATNVIGLEDGFVHVCVIFGVVDQRSG